MINTIISLFFSGILFGSGPCLASCGPFLVSYIAGTGKGVLKGLALYFLFSLAKVAIYLILAVAVFFLGSLALEGFLGRFSKFIFILGGAFISLTGLAMLWGKHLAFFPRINSAAKSGKNIAIYGLIIGLLPCAPLLSVLAYTGLVARSWPQSLFYGFFFGLGTVISPLILLVMLSGAIPQFLLNKKPLYCRAISFLCSLVIIFLGLQLILRAL